MSQTADMEIDAPPSPSNMDLDAHPRSSAPPESTTSSPLSQFSKSPSVPSSPDTHIDASKRYPSPTSSMPSGAQSPVKLETPDDSVPVIQLDGPVDSINVNPSDAPDGQPPRKRRKVTPPKERTTQHLDLGECDENDENLMRLVSALKKRKKIVVIAGAGISVSAGIPDFRSKQGLFATLPNSHKMKGSGKHLFDASVYKHDSSTEKFHNMICDLSTMVKAAKPTAFHHLLASLAHEKRLLRLYSQNVDCIDTNMEPLKTAVPLNVKGPWPTTIQLHGSVEHMVCSKCADIKPLKTELFVGHEAPLCEECKTIDQLRTQFEQRRSHGIGRLRPRMVLYNEFNPDEEAIGKVSSIDLKSRPDAVIVVGTSLKIPGVRRLVKELCQVTRSRRDGFTAWINVDSEPQHNDFKDCWDLVVRGKCDDVAHWASLPRFDEPKGDGTAYLSEKDERQRQTRLARDSFEVALSLPTPGSPAKSESGSATAEAKKRKLVSSVQSIPTPTASPRIKAAEAGKKASRSKQSKLAFGGLAVSENDASTGMIKKTTTKKPRKSKKPTMLPKNPISQTFKTQKNRELADMPQEALAGKLDNQHYKYVEGKPNSQLPPLRPEAQEPAKDIYYPQKQVDKSCRNENGSSATDARIPARTLASGRKSLPNAALGGVKSRTDVRPATPMHERRKSADTISPTTVPVGMGHLID